MQNAQCTIEVSQSGLFKNIPAKNSLCLSLAGLHNTARGGSLGREPCTQKNRSRLNRYLFKTPLFFLWQVYITPQETEAWVGNQTPNKNCSRLNRCIFKNGFAFIWQVYITPQKCRGNLSKEFPTKNRLCLSFAGLHNTERGQAKPCQVKFTDKNRYIMHYALCIVHLI